jgi:hypothetical protein
MLQLIESPDYEGVRVSNGNRMLGRWFPCAVGRLRGQRAEMRRHTDIVDLAFVTTRPGCQA